MRMKNKYKFGDFVKPLTGLYEQTTGVITEVIEGGYKVSFPSGSSVYCPEDGVELTGEQRTKTKEVAMELTGSKVNGRPVEELDYILDQNPNLSTKHLLAVGDTLIVVFEGGEAY